MPVTYDPFSYEVHEDPYPIYRRLREEAPAYENQEKGFWALSRYDDVRNALLDHETFCSRYGFTIEDTGEIGLPMILAMDPPEHTRLRNTIHRALTPRRVAALEPAIRARAAALLDRLCERGEGDLIADFAAILPMSVIADLLSVPEADRDELRRWADDLVHRDDRLPGIPPRGLQAARRIGGYFEDMLRALAVRPRDDLLSLLLAAEEHGEISRAELLGFCFILIIAGNETTTKLIGNMAFQLHRHPDQRRRLAADPSRIPNAVEEVLRYDSSTHMMARTLTRAVRMHGKEMPAGKKVALILASANRDPRRFPDPDRFDVTRDTRGHLAFGIGVHHCLGAALARLEATVTLQEMMARMPELWIEESGLERVHSGNVRGFSRVPFRAR